MKSFTSCSLMMCWGGLRMANKLLHGEQARAALLRGINQVADAVGSTLGPKASNVAIAKLHQNPQVTHDGVTVAKSIILEDPFEDMGAQLIREAAAKTNDIAGDGTTTATVLARAMVVEGDKYIKSGANAQLIKSGIEKATKKVLDELKKYTTSISTPQELTQVATISAASEELGALVADAVVKAGKGGVVTLNEVPVDDITIDHTKGMEFDRGFRSNYFITDDKNRAAIADPYILITDKRLSTQTDIIPFIELVTKTSKNLMVIADDIDGEALAMLVVNKLEGRFNALAVKAPAFGLRRKQILEDIAVLTGGTVLSEDTGRAMSTLSLSDLGRAERVISDKDKTQIINGKGDYDLIDARIKSVKADLEQATNEFDRDEIKKRLAKLTDGVVVINVGGRTEVEMKQTKFRIEDAVNATQAAQAEGIVPGGETALMKASRCLDLNEYTGDEQLAVSVVKKALSAPFKTLLANAGITDGELIAQALKAEGNMGINVMTEKITDLVKDGVIDPVKVTKSALNYASSVACEVLTTNVLIAEVEK